MKIEKLFLSLLGLTLFIPSFGSVDLLAPRTLYLSLINLIIFVYYKNLIFSTIKQIGLVFYLFSLLTLLSFLSFFYAINPDEVFINSTLLYIYSSSLVSFFIVISKFKNDIFIFQKFISILLFVEIIFLFISFFSVQFDFSSRFNFAGSSANINISTFSILFKLPLLIYFYDYLKNSFLKLIFLCLIASSVFFVLIQGSRGGLIVLILFLISYFTISYKSKIISRPIFIFYTTFFLFFASISLISNNNILISRASTLTEDFTNDASLNYRSILYKNSIISFLDHPLLGVGSGNYKISSIEYNKNQMSSYVVPYHNHNDFLEFLVELGLLGFLFYSSIFLYLFFLIYRIKAVTNYNLFITCLLPFSVFLFDSLINFPFARVSQYISFVAFVIFIILTYRRNYVSNNI